MRPDVSQARETRGSRPGLSIVAAQLAIAGDQDQRVLVGRSLRLGEALAGLPKDLAAARREIAQLKRENATLRSQLDPLGRR